MPNRKSKPAKPYPEFPLFAHATGRWAKKIRGKFCYFGRWDDPDAALQKYLDEVDDLQAGRTPRANRDGLTVRTLANEFLTAKTHLLNNGEIVPQTFAEYHRTCEKVVSVFSKDRLVIDLVASDFQHLRSVLATGLGPVALGNAIQRVRSVFKFAYDSGLIDVPVRFGTVFKRPPRRLVREVRNAAGPRMFEANELRSLIGAAKMPLRAMILLGVNCGFGNTDVSRLTQEAVDTDSSFVDFPRPKTGVRRRCPLWPETKEAVQAATASRPSPKDAKNSNLVFITKYGNPWVRIDWDGKRHNTDSIGLAFGKLLRNVGIKRPKVNFYALRHTFETIAGESKDQVAVNAIMGHVDTSMAAVYRERISDERLQAVVDVVRGWLWPEGCDASPDDAASAK